MSLDLPLAVRGLSLARLAGGSIDTWQKAQPKPYRLMRTTWARILAVWLVPVASLPAVDLVTFNMIGQNGEQPSQPAASVATGVSATSLVRGPGVGDGSWFDGFANSFGGALFREANLANAITNGDYLGFTLTPQPGQMLNIEQIVYSDLRNGTGTPNVALVFSLNGFTTSTVLQQYSFNTPLVATPRDFDANDNPSAFALLQGVTSTIDIRIFAWNASSTAGQYAITSGSSTAQTPFVVRGNVIPIPEPAAGAGLVAGLVLAAVLWLRRSRA